MTAYALIEEARADGLELRSNGGKLNLSGLAEVVERWKPRIVASKAEILAALSVPPAPGHITACSTCAHVTGRGGCGEPVAAGLSDLPGVIRYSHDQGATCPAILSGAS